MDRPLSLLREALSASTYWLLLSSLLQPCTQPRDCRTPLQLGNIRDFEEQCLQAGQ